MNRTNNASYGFQGKRHTEAWKTSMRGRKRSPLSAETRIKLRAAWVIRKQNLRPLSRLERRARHYGVDVGVLERLDAATSGLCHVCLIRSWTHIDHDHATGQVRGLLCRQCNFALGHLEDDWMRTMRAAFYLGGWRL